MNQSVSYNDAMFFAEVNSYITHDDDRKLIKHAYDYAKVKHEGQYRKSGEPYFVHLINVGTILAQLRVGPSTIAAGLQC